MKLIVAPLLALALLGGTAEAATPLDGTFNGSFSCPKFQGVTNALVTFIVTGYKVRGLLTLYYSQNSKYGFRNSVLDYAGFYNPTKKSFSLSSFKQVGVEPNGWSYDKFIHGTVLADGSQVSMDGNASCTGLTAQRVTATSGLAK